MEQDKNRELERLEAIGKKLRHLMAILKGENVWNYNPNDNHLFCQCSRVDKGMTRGMAIYDLTIACLNSGSYTIENILAKVLEDSEVKRVIPLIPHSKRASFKKNRRISNRRFRDQRR